MAHLLATLEDTQAVAEIVDALVTALAVVVGGGWALWRFGRERTYRPRLDIDLSGSALPVGGVEFFLARIRVKNIGTSEVNLRQHGTGLRVSKLQGGTPTGGAAVWQPIRVWPVFEEHAWIEPSETVSDDLLLHLDGVAPGAPLLLEARLVWFNDQSRGPVVVRARRVVRSADALTEVPTPTSEEEP